MRNLELNKKRLINLFKLVGFGVIVVLVVSVIDKNLNSFNLKYYQSKDNGVSIMFYSILILSTLFNTLILDSLKFSKILLNVIVGISLGLISSLVSYLIFMLFLEKLLYFHIIAIIMSCSFCVVFRYFIQTSNKISSTNQ